MTDSIKKCPMCAEEIIAEAKLCRFCGARFEVALRGYCISCHDLQETDENGNCRVCGRELADRHVESRFIDERNSLPVLESATDATAVVPEDNFAGLEQIVRGLLQRNKKIEAIAAYRKATKTGLLEAKKAVEAFESGAPFWIPRKG